MLKTGVLGLGKMGKLHFMSCRHIDDLEVTAVADASERNLDWAKSRGITNLYKDYNELFKKEDLDAVIITLPHFLHVQSGISAAENGINFFMEKPLANTVSEGETIINAAKKNNIKFMIGCNSRFISSVKKLNEMYNNGIFGDIEVATLDNFGGGPFSPHRNPTPVPEWYFDINKIGGGVLLDLGYHMIDLFQWFFPNSKLEYACLSNRYDLPYEDCATIVLTSKKTGTRGVINLGWFMKSIFPKFDFRIALHGTGGFGSTDELTPNIYINAMKEGFGNVLRKCVGKRINPLTYTYIYASHFKEIKHFVECIKMDKEPVIKPQEALEVLKTIEEGYRIAEGFR